MSTSPTTSSAGPVASDPRGQGASTTRRRPRRSWWIVGLLIAALVVILLVPLASRDPDGLQRVAQDNGFIEAAQDWVYRVFAGYQVPGLEGQASTIVAGLIGIAVVFGLAMVAGRLLARRRNH